MTTRISRYNIAFALRRLGRRAVDLDIGNALESLRGGTKKVLDTLTKGLVHALAALFLYLEHVFGPLDDFFEFVALLQQEFGANVGGNVEFLAGAAFFVVYSRRSVAVTVTVAIRVFVQALLDDTLVLA